MVQWRLCRSVQDRTRRSQGWLHMFRVRLRDTGFHTCSESHVARTCRTYVRKNNDIHAGSKEGLLSKSMRLYLSDFHLTIIAVIIA